jgi:hypothetical protein
MLLLITGVALTLMGCLAGALLLCMPAGPSGEAPSWALWLLFPLFVLLGYALAVIGARRSQWHGLTLGLGAVLLMLALAAALGLVLSAAGVWHAPLGTLPLWYVMVLAGLPGAIGVASGQREQA